MIAEGLAIAALVWGTPACGSPSVVWSNTADDFSGAALIDTCTIELNGSELLRWPPRARRERVCQIIVHEWGHLTGHGHSDDPTNVMAADPTKVYWRCTEKWRAKFVRIAHKRGLPRPLPVCNKLPKEHGS